MKSSKKRRTIRKKHFYRCQNPSIKGHKKWSQFKQQLKAWAREIKQELVEGIFSKEKEQQLEKQASQKLEQRTDAEGTGNRPKIA